MQREAARLRLPGASLIVRQFWQCRTVPKLKAASIAAKVMQKQSMNLVVLIGMLVMGLPLLRG